MYTEEDVNNVLSQVEQEFEKALGSIVKNEEEIVEEVSEETQAQEEELTKSEKTQEESEEEEYETIDELYASMSKSEKEAHYNSIKTALFGEEEAVKEEVIAKSEEVAEEVESQEEKKEEVLSKSESEKLKSENEELKKNFDTLNELVGKLFNSKKAPAQKAITANSYIAKSEEIEDEKVDISKMSKSEIKEKIKAVNFENLEKSDRDAINDFYLNNGSVEKIKHLIKE